VVESRTHEPSTDVCIAGHHTGEGKVRGHAGASVTGADRRWWHDFAVRGVFWRRFVDWGARNIPAFSHRPLIWIAAFLFFFIAAPARKALLRNMRLIRPDSWRAINYLRVVRVFANFGWSLTDAAAYRMSRARFRYELEGGRFLNQLGSSKGAIVLTAHMGNYDLGAALFAARFDRQIRMVRAPEPDALAARHVDLALRESTAGAVKVGYSDDGTSLALDLLNALRNGEIISIQGDRVVGDVARARVKFFGHQVFLPNGPFVLSLASETPIFPLFIVRTGFRKYKIVVREPITCMRRTGGPRDQIIAEAMQRWAQVLQEVVRSYWPQWFAFTPSD
jgi:phosphatidylinositol dimannoside acyltransferase